MGYRIIVALIMIVSLAGCAFQQPLPNADYRDPPSSFDSIPGRMSDLLKDPYSAKYRYHHAPVKGYANNGLLHGGDVAFFGWMVPFEVNAKNSFGAYTGWQPYVAYYKGNWIAFIRPGTLGQQALVTVVE